MQLLAQSRHENSPQNYYLFFIFANIMSKHLKNCPDWVANERDYLLVFMPVKDGKKCSLFCDGFEWREVSSNLEKYKGVLLADYLSSMGLYIPDYTQFLRIIDEEKTILYRAYDCMRVTIDVKYRDK